MSDDSTLLDRPLDYLLTLEGLPDWLARLMPYAWAAVKIAVAVALAYAASSLVKRIIRFFGRRRAKRKAIDFEGSAGDLGASLAQFFVLVVSAPYVLGIAGIDVQPFLDNHMPGIIAAFVTLALGIAASRWVGGAIRRFGARANKARRGDDTLFSFIASATAYGILVFAAILALTQIGIQTGSLIAVVGAAGLAIALALQDTLKAVASGVMLAIFRPFRIGDWVLIAGAEGEVVDITPFHTTVKPVDNKAVIIPNDQAFTQPITNFTRFPRRRLDLYFEISYDDDIGHALEVMREAVLALPRVLAKEDYWGGVHSLEAYSVKLRARPWIATSEFLDMRSACTRAVKEAFDREGITIPYPHQVEYQIQERKPGANQVS